MVFFRNRIMHYEPIHHRDLAADHAKVYRLLGYFRPSVIPQARRHDDVLALLAERPTVRRPLTEDS